MLRYLLAVMIVLLLLLGWLGVQWLARRQARRHPEFGAAREEGRGCGGCRGNACRRDD